MKNSGHLHLVQTSDFSTRTAPHASPIAPPTSLLQRRTARLRNLISRTDRSLVIALAELGSLAWHGPNAEVAKCKLTSNIQQLHRARNRLLSRVIEMENKPDPTPEPAA